MSTILDKIIENKRVEVEREKKETDVKELISCLSERSSKGAFKNALESSSTGIIAEFKRRSPSKGWIFENARIEEVVPLYSQNGASAISILTDSVFFGGTIEDLKKGRQLVKTPLLRKEFVIDEYQLYQAAVSEADAILLIASALTVKETRLLAKKANELGLDVLLEIHNEKELDHLNEYADVIGVNNRNLSTFVTDVGVSFELAGKIPAEFTKISESGISRSQTVKDLRQAGYRGFLMGENFMKTANPGKALQLFIDELT